MASTSSSSSSTSRSWKYDVFLSFRGKDTRKTFVDHLYYALKQRAILTYKDDVTLGRGDTVGPAVLSAIETSQILVIIFSENYADSSWCLDELSHIMKCRDSEQVRIVFPIFYHVDPSDVRKQKGQFGEAFAELSDKNKKKVETWKKALDDASNIAGWETTQVANGHEAKCIQEIVDSIIDKLASLNPVINDENLVGMEHRLKDLKSQLKIGSGGVRMVGIWGIGGGGKTTLATSLYLELKVSGHFDGCCFVENIREESKQQHGLKSLQKRILAAVFGREMQVESVEIGKKKIQSMLSGRNVLIVLDDVDNLDQLKALAGSLAWFGDGSRIIITTRDEHLLTTHRVDVVSPISLLSHDEAIRLFNKHGYCDHKPVQDYEMLSQQIVSYADGLPLALIILSSFLYGKDKDEWLSTLARLKEHPDMDILEKLKISYDGLQPVEKELFLDIACFHRGTKEDDAMKILDACGFYPVSGVKVLIQKALITVSMDGRFDMHDLVQEMGHYIVRGEPPYNPEKHSRVWRIEDIEDMCSRNGTTENDETEAMQCYGHGYSSFKMLVSNMKKLRFLRVSIQSNYDGGPSFLSNELRYLEWVYYPASPFPETFQPRKLVVLKIRKSLQKELWKGCTYLPCLKELELEDARALVRTPDFGGLPCLQKLILKGCESLEEIHESLGNHSSLVSVNIRSCDKLRRFPTIVKMDKLKILIISKCKALAVFLQIEASMDNLKSVEGKFHALKCQKKSKLSGCRQFEKLPKEHLRSSLNLKSGSIKQRILSHIPRFLRKLNLSCNHFTQLDFSLSRLTSLKVLELTGCDNLVEVPELPSSLSILKADYCYSLEGIIRDEIHTNCKWLSQVSIVRGRKNIIGGERLLETMLQGNAGVESGCMFLQLQGLDIARGFEPGLVKGGRCGMQLPENWFNDFSGFLMCAVVDTPGSIAFDPVSPRISMKHEENGGLEDCQYDVVHWEENRQHGDYTWAGYVSFGLLRHTSWWDPTSTAIQIQLHSYYDTLMCGFKLVPKTGGESSGQMETTTTTHSSEISLNDDPYKCQFRIHHDSKSALQCSFDHYEFDQYGGLFGVYDSF